MELLLVPQDSVGLYNEKCKCGLQLRLPGERRPRGTWDVPSRRKEGKRCTGDCQGLWRREGLLGVQSGRFSDVCPSLHHLVPYISVLSSSTSLREPRLHSREVSQRHLRTHQGSLSPHLTPSPHTQKRNSNCVWVLLNVGLINLLSQVPKTVDKLMGFVEKAHLGLNSDFAVK